MLTCVDKAMISTPCRPMSLLNAVAAKCWLFMMAWRTSYEGLSVRCAEPLKPSRAAAMVPMVTAMCIQVRKVLSLAKNVLGSIRMGVVLCENSQ